MKKFVTCVCGHPQWWHIDGGCRPGCWCKQFVSQEATQPYPTVPKAPVAVPDATGDPYEAQQDVPELPAGPRVWIERLLFDKAGHVVAVDLHDETHGEAIFCEAVNRHFHGRYGKDQ